MRHRRSPIDAILLVLFLAGIAGVLFVSSLAAAPLPGTGYDLQKRGISRSRYYSCLQYQDAAGRARPCLEISKPIDFSSNPYNFTIGTPAFANAFDARWGRPVAGTVPPDTGSFRRKKWSFLDNERGGLAREAIEWACRTRPDILGIVSGSRTCVATDLEIIDFSAGYDIDLMRAYYDAVVEGARPDRRLVVDQVGKPCEYAEPDIWWFGWNVFYRNPRACGATTPPVVTTPPVTTPPVTTPPTTTGPVTVTPLPSPAWIDEALVPLRQALAALQAAIAKLEAQKQPSTARVGVRVVP